ncbi:MAG TPA: alpha/beta fold hydrolase [Jatrophihabitans sp.]|uniref:PHA/PHB synthase family protein n=1 Tax=Jatrophihabitans sp. TaxID=1932789 RepID=UPI002E01F0B9|nr:alpha/beta fold hydrolase [Jatrophihabitans sp.]
MDATSSDPTDTANSSDRSGADAVGAAAPMDTMLAEAGTTLGRWLPGRAGLRFAAALARTPAPAARLAGDTVAELARIAVGRSEITWDRRDKRFADEAWTGNPVLHRIAQAYLAAGGAAERLVEELPLDWRTEQRIRFLTENVVEALAPTNTALLNPAAWKAAIDSGGTTLTRGAAAMVRDLAKAPRVPRMVEPDAFAVGRDLAMTPGSVVFRNPLIELIEYAPQTEQVREVPLLIVPPTINKFYVVDLSPGRSLVEHLVQAGQHVFMVSWRNPRSEGAEWGADAYAEAIVEALDAVEKISGSPKTALLALCSGGMLTSMLVAHLAATGQQHRIAALSLLVTVLDQHHAGTPGALSDRRASEASTARSERKGYLDGAALAEVFAWLRPRDLVWNYWVNNYLLGKPPPAFDILSWNADTTRMPAKLHHDFIALAQDNLLTKPGAATLCGSPVDLSQIDVDSYVVAGVADHLCPWQNCYQTTRLLGGTTRFVLSTSGHIAAIVNPPGNEKASFHAGEFAPDDAEKWLENAEKQKGSWWTDYTDWLAARTGARRDAPAEPGLNGFEPLADAPGTYVLER